MHHADEMARASRKSQWTWLASCGFLLASLAVRLIPFSPLMPTDGLDPSWMMGMGYGIEHGLHIGTELIFNFGPLANIYTGLYSDSLDIPVMLCSAYLVLAFFLPIHAVTYERKHWPPVVLYALLVLVMGFMKDPFLMFAPAMMTVGILSSPRHGAKRVTRRYCRAALLCMPALGILPLVKISLAAICILCTATNALIFSCRRMYALCRSICRGPASTSVALWMMSGQEVDGIFSYAMNSIPIVSGYVESMATSPTGSTLHLDMLLFLLGALVVIGGLYKARTGNGA